MKPSSWRRVALVAVTLVLALGHLGPKRNSGEGLWEDVAGLWLDRKALRHCPLVAGHNPTT
jgi:hypothetical protein